MAERLSKQERREQLLSVADSIVRNSGTDELTLITLADKAGVTKALTYGHFSTREGLLAALYKRYDDRVIAETQATIASGAKTIESAVSAVVNSYMFCVCSSGNQHEAIVSALLAYPAHKNIRLCIRNFFVDAYEEIFGPFTNYTGKEFRLKLMALFGCIEEISRAVSAKECSTEDAIRSLTSTIIAILKW